MLTFFASFNPCSRAAALWFGLLGMVACAAPAISAQAQAPEARPRDEVIVVVGAGGTDEYAAAFTESARELQRLAATAELPFHWLGAGREAAHDPPSTDSDAAASAERERSHREELRQKLAELTPAGDQRLWLILMGHGTFDGVQARFNLEGPDLSAQELAQWLAPMQRPLIIVNCSSASAPFINALSGPRRTVITATQSGSERNYSRFGQFFAEAFDRLAADLDKDQQVSLLEAFLFASAQVDEFYANESRLATEHALLDDNGDERGTPADWYDGFRLAAERRGALPEGTQPDGLRAHLIHLLPSPREAQMTAAQRERRDRLESELEQLRWQRETLTEQEYLHEVELRARQLAALYAELDPAPSRETRVVLPARSGARPPRPATAGKTRLP